MMRVSYRIGTVMGSAAVLLIALTLALNRQACADEPAMVPGTPGEVSTSGEGGTKECYQAAWDGGFSHCPRIDHCNVGVKVVCETGCSTLTTLRIRDEADEVVAKENGRLDDVRILAANVPVGKYTFWVGTMPLETQACESQQTMVMEVPVFELAINCTGSACDRVRFEGDRAVIRRFPALRRQNASAMSVVQVAVAGKVWLVEVKSGRHELNIKGKRARSPTLKVGRPDRH